VIARTDPNDADKFVKLGNNDIVWDVVIFLLLEYTNSIPPMTQVFNRKVEPV
jgi:hypothetical protein